MLSGWNIENHWFEEKASPYNMPSRRLPANDDGSNGARVQKLVVLNWRKYFRRRELLVVEKNCRTGCKKFS
jgi:hypothetical protein